MSKTPATSRCRFPRSFPSKQKKWCLIAASWNSGFGAPLDTRMREKIRASVESSAFRPTYTRPRWSFLDECNPPCDERNAPMNVKDANVRRLAPLRTPTDLTEGATRDIAAALNLLLADMFALYIKTKN